LLPVASSFTGFGVSVSNHSLPGILRIWPGFLWSVFTASVGLLKGITVDFRRLLYGEGINCHSHVNYIMQNSLTRSFCCFMLTWRHIIRLRTNAILFILQNLIYCKNTTFFFTVSPCILIHWILYTN
jgi:hypothetical protein